MHAKSLQLCLTLCNPMDCCPPGSSVQGISQARILEWDAISSSRGSPWPRDRTHVTYASCIGRWIFFTTSTTWEELRRFYKPGNRNQWTNLDRKVWPGCQLLDWVSHGHYFHLRTEWPAGLFRPLLSLPGGTAWERQYVKLWFPLWKVGTWIYYLNQTTKHCREK